MFSARSALRATLSRIIAPSQRARRSFALRMRRLHSALADRCGAHRVARSARGMAAASVQRERYQSKIGIWRRRNGGGAGVKMAKQSA
jgi:hypothetical protein